MLSISICSVLLLAHENLSRNYAGGCGAGVRRGGVRRSAVSSAAALPNQPVVSEGR